MASRVDDSGLNLHHDASLPDSLAREDITFDVTSAVLSLLWRRSPSDR